MIAEAPNLRSQPRLTIVRPDPDREREPAPELCLAQVVGTLQLLLAARRAERASRK